MRKVGVRMEVEPTVGADGYTIDLNLAPEVVEFEGFINYGSPIQSSAQDALGNPTTITLTEDVINQPVFSLRTLKTSVTVFDGSTVVMGGLIREIKTWKIKFLFLATSQSWVACSKPRLKTTSSAT